jgi:chromosome partitioning protein
MAPVDMADRPTRSGVSIPIITVAAMKGGVGKTTLTANLAAYLDKRGKRVLLIDLDYQGSLSHMLTSAANISKKSSAVDELISGRMSPSLLMQRVESLGSALPNTKLLTCYYQFSDKETDVMIEWACKTRHGQHAEEIRFRIEALLHKPEVQAEFDIVLIDAPPRFSTGAMNALCASTHVIIPTVLDVMSAEAAVYFSQDISAMRQELFPSLKLIGVIPSMTFQNQRFTQREEDLIDYLNDSLRKYWGSQKVVLSKAAIPRKNALGNVAGKDIAYLDAGTKKDTAEIRKIFDRVGLSIMEKLK